VRVRGFGFGVVALDKPAWRKSSTGKLRSRRPLRLASCRHGSHRGMPDGSRRPAPPAEAAASAAPSEPPCSALSSPSAPRRSRASAASAALRLWRARPLTGKAAGSGKARGWLSLAAAQRSCVMAQCMDNTVETGDPGSSSSSRKWHWRGVLCVWLGARPVPGWLSTGFAAGRVLPHHPRRRWSGRDAKGAPLQRVCRRRARRQLGRRRCFGSRGSLVGKVEHRVPEWETWIHAHPTHKQLSNLYSAHATQSCLSAQLQRS
jgi:hypothetical protein